MWIGSLISSVLGNILLGPGTLYKSQDFQFVDYAHVGDLLSIEVTLVEKNASPDAIFETKVSLADGKVIASGRASVAAPTQSINLETNSLPGLLLDEHDHFHRLIEEAKRFPPMATAVVCPDDSKSMAGTYMAMTEGLISPIFIGSQSKIEAAAKEAGVDISMIEIINIADSRMVAARAVELVHEKRVHAIMKGGLHSDPSLSSGEKGRWFMHQ